MLAFFLNSLGNTFDLRWGDEDSLTYLACISPLWLPVPLSSGPRYTHYSAHRVLRQFGFDQDILPVFKEVVPSLPSLDPFLRLQAFSYQSWRSPQFVVPNSQREVFASYWRRVQKSFSDFFGSSKIERVPDSSLFSTPTFNKRLVLPTASIVSAAISNKTGFAEWHASRGGWVCYVNDFPDTWSGCDLIVGAVSSGVPIKRKLVLQLLWAKVRRRRSSRKLSRELRLKKALRVLRLALRLKRGKLLSLVSS